MAPANTATSPGVLLSILLATAALVLARDARVWLPTIRATGEQRELRWLLAFAGCCALPWLISRWSVRTQVHTFSVL